MVSFGVDFLPLEILFETRSEFDCFTFYRVIATPRSQLTMNRNDYYRTRLLSRIVSNLYYRIAFLLLVNGSYLTWWINVFLILRRKLHRRIGERSRGDQSPYRLNASLHILLTFSRFP